MKLNIVLIAANVLSRVSNRMGNSIKKKPLTITAIFLDTLEVHELMNDLAALDGKYEITIEPILCPKPNKGGNPMRNGRKPTRAQKMLLIKCNLSPDNWLILSDTPERLVIRHRISEKIRALDRTAGKEKFHAEGSWQKVLNAYKKAKGIF